MRASFQTKLIPAPSGVRKKFPLGRLKFRRTVTPHINIMESAKGKTIAGWSGTCSGKNLQNYTKKYALSCILEASFSIMLSRDLLKE